MSQVALEHLPVAGAHHLVLYTIIVIAWVRRKSLERLFAVYFATAFASAAYALLSHEGARAWGAMSVVVAGLWLAEAIRPRGTYAFRHTPRPRLFVMAALAAFGLLYPGYSAGLPAFVFSPLGVILHPTLIASISLLNAASPDVGRRLHWSSAAVGLAVSVHGAIVEGWSHAPLAVASAYAVALLLGKGRRRDASEPAGATSVRQIRERMYSRRTFLPGPADRRRRTRPGRIRRG